MTTPHSNDDALRELLHRGLVPEDLRPDDPQLDDVTDDATGPKAAVANDRADQLTDAMLEAVLRESPECEAMTDADVARIVRRALDIRDELEASPPAATSSSRFALSSRIETPETPEADFHTQTSAPASPGSSAMIAPRPLTQPSTPLSTQTQSTQTQPSFAQISRSIRSGSHARIGDLREDQRESASGRAAAVVVVLALLAAAGLPFWFGDRTGSNNGSNGASNNDGGTSLGNRAGGIAAVATDDDASSARSRNAFVGFRGLTARPLPQSQPVHRVAVGDEIVTGPRQKQRLTLPDGSILYVNENTTARIETTRRVKLDRGEVFVEVVPQFKAADAKQNETQKAKFVVAAADRDVTALGTKFAVRAGTQPDMKDAGDAHATELLVVQGRVKVDGLKVPVDAGQEAVIAAGESHIAAGPRASEALDWTRELMAAATPPLVPASERAGGNLVVVDPDGQEMKLELRNFHVDVYIEDGFARTTVDQTYFNHTHSRQEGTFYFPIPPDASLSRLAMYVGDKLMEGGMLERGRARNVFEEIMYTKRDPALLEWVDGSTFKMRVFPLEPRDEKRILLSYTQRLPDAYGKTGYRFPAGHSLELVRHFSTQIRVKDGAKANAAGDAPQLKWQSPSHQFVPATDGDDLVLTFAENRIALEKDVVLELTDADPQAARPGKDVNRFTSQVHEGRRYLMLRHRPHLAGPPRRPNRDFSFIFESSGDRDPLLARTQIEIVKSILENAEHDDTFAIVTAGTNCDLFSSVPVACTVENIERAVEHLEQTHLIGALDLGKALEACERFFDRETRRERCLVHVGSGVPVLGERKQDALLRMLPEDVRYIGVGVGKRWNRDLMQAAAAATRGFSTQINPDEDVAWRSFELMTQIDAPMLQDVTVTATDADAEKGGKTLAFLNHDDVVAQGEELCAVTRLPENAKLPKTVVVTATLDGKPYRREIKVEDVADGAGYLPRTWAKLEISRMVGEGAAQNREAIIALSKSMYVISPFTSLLVLENEAMYQQYKVDRGRKDHWALYPAPEVLEAKPNLDENADPEPPALPEAGDNDGEQPKSVAAARAARLREKRDALLSTILIRIPPDVLMQPGQPSYGGRVVNAWQVVHGGYALPVQYPGVSGLAALDAGELLGLTTEAEGRRRKPTEFNRLGRTDLGELIQFEKRIADMIRLPEGYEVAAREQLIQWETATTATPRPRSSREAQLKQDLFGRIVLSNSAVNSQFGDVEARLTSPEYARFGYFPQLGQFYPQQSSSLGVDRLSSVMYTNGRAYNPLGWGAPNLEWRDWGLHGNRNGFSVPQPGTISLGGIQFSEGGFGGGGFGGGIGGEMGGGGPSPIYSFYTSGLGRNRPAVNVWNANGAAGFIPNFSGPVGNNVWFERARSTRPQGLLPSLEQQDPVLTTGLDFKTTNEFLIPVDGFERRVNLNDINGNLFFDFDGDRVVPFTLNLSDGDVPVRSFVDPSGEVKLRFTDEDSPESLPAAIRLDLRNLNGEGVADKTRREQLAEIEKAWNAARRTVLEKLIALTQHRVKHGLVPAQPQPVNPYFSHNQHVFGDLVAWAPGMNTTAADVRAVLAAELPAEDEPATGRVDKAARRLIEQARSRGWESVSTRPVEIRIGEDAKPAGGSNRRFASEPFTILYDGSGRYRYTRVVGEGLRETVVCDGETLRHLYPEIGLGAKRTMGRVYRAEFNSLVPWLVPLIDELARGRNVTAIDERAISITPVGAEDRTTKDGKPASYLAARLIFDDEHRLTERRLVLMPEDRRLLSTTYSADGTVRLTDGDDKLVVTYRLPRRAADSPDLSPDVSKLVVLPMPGRNSSHVHKRHDEIFSVKRADLSEEAALEMLTSDIPAQFAPVIAERFFNKGDHRLGFYTLLVSRGLNVRPGATQEVAENVTLHFNPTGEHPDSPLAEYLKRYQNRHLNGPQSFGSIENLKSDGLLKRLTTLRDLSSWLGKDPTNVKFQRRIHRFARECRSPELAWTALSHYTTDTPAELHKEAAGIYAELEHAPGLYLAARRERARRLFLAGDVAAGREAVRRIVLDAADRGTPPAVDDGLWKLFHEGNTLRNRRDLMRDAVRRMVKAHARTAAMTLAYRVHTNGDPELAAEMYDLAVKDVPEAQSVPVTLAAAWYQTAIVDYEQAESLIRPLLDDERFAKSTDLWRLGSHLASATEQFSAAAEREERAVQLDYADLPEQVNLKVVRERWSNLLDRLYEAAEELTRNDAPVDPQFVRRVIRAADQWRSLDVDDAAACRAAARVFRLLGEDDLAWEYATTPLAEKPNEGSPLASLAAELKNAGEVEAADRMYQRAFEAETTNAQILWDHAQLLLESNRKAEADALLNRLANGQWQPRFRGLQSQARQKLLGASEGDQKK